MWLLTALIRRIFKPEGKSIQEASYLPQKRIFCYIWEPKNKDLDYLIEAAKSFVGTNTDLYMIDRDDGHIKNMEKSVEELGIALRQVH